MQETQKLPGDAAGVAAPPARRQGKRGTRPWREVIGEFRASGLTIQAYSERSGISRSSMTRYLALASHAERSVDVQQSAGATAATAALSNHFCIPISIRAPPVSGVNLIVSAVERPVRSRNVLDFRA